MIGSLIMLMAAAASSQPITQNYSCEIEAPKMVVPGTDKIVDVGVPDSAKSANKLSLSVTYTPKSIEAKIDWAGDPYQMAGKFSAIPIGSDAISILTVSPGPCMFTEQTCASLIQLTRQADGSAKLLILPGAILSDDKSNVRTPFAVMITGNCTPMGASK